MFVVHNTNTKVIVCFNTNDEMCKVLPDIVDDSDYMLTFIYEGELGQPMKDVTRDYLVVEEEKGVIMNKLKDACKLVIEYISDKDNPWYSDFRCLTENRTYNVHNDLKEFIKDMAVTGPDFEIFNDAHSCDVCAFLLNIYAHSIDTKCGMALCYASKFNFEHSFAFANDICKYLHK